MTPMLSIKDVAAHLRMCPKDVKKLIELGELQAINVGFGMKKGRWRIDPEWLDRFKKLRSAVVVPEPPRRRQPERKRDYERLVTI